eukprot:38706-Alexandrium_andersonii.AAC.1
MSSANLERRLGPKLLGMGIKTLKCAKDLGVDDALARARRITAQRSRLGRALRRASKLRGLAA